jgi:hypothetical protein
MPELLPTSGDAADDDDEDVDVSDVSDYCFVWRKEIQPNGISTDFSISFFYHSNRLS